MRKILVAGGVCVMALVLATSGGGAQESPSKPEKAVKAKLPTYFGQIGLSKKQEEEIRKAAQPFEEKIAQLRKQISDLEKQVDEQEMAKLSACEQLLTEGQRAALKERRETALSEKTSRKSKKTSNGDSKKPDEK